MAMCLLSSWSGLDEATRSRGAPVRFEPNPIKRRGVGFRGYDPERAFPGFTLFAPYTTNRTVYLIDLQGNVVHTWEMPHPPGMYGYLTDRGTLFYNGKIPDASHFGGSRWKGGAALEVDWTGRVLWEIRHPDHHHDGIRLRNGNVLLVCSKLLPAEIIPKIRGGRPGSEYDNGKMNGDYLVEMTTDGRIVWEWPSWEYLDPVEDAITSVGDNRDEWTHCNAVCELPDDNIMVSFRNISTVVMVNRRTGQIYWKLGAPPLAGQHAPNLLPNGHVLLFDNGPHRLDDTFPFSRVLDIEPFTRTIVWTYQEALPWNFFSPRVSNAQRLPNGNTLISEGVFGRFFEVTRQSDIVWEYVNPYFGPMSAAAAHARPETLSNAVFRVYRYTPEEIAKAQAAT